jgi:hypothetical protein
LRRTVPLGLGFRVAHLDLPHVELRLGLIDLGLERARIDLEQ